MAARSCVIGVSSRDLQPSRERRCQDHNFEPRRCRDALSSCFRRGSVFPLIHIWCSSIPPIRPCLRLTAEFPLSFHDHITQATGDDVHHEDNAHYDPLKKLYCGRFFPWLELSLSTMAFRLTTWNGETPLELQDPLTYTFTVNGIRFVIRYREAEEF